MSDVVYCNKRMIEVCNEGCRPFITEDEVKRLAPSAAFNRLYTWVKVSFEINGRF